ncbi:MAG TPA: DUF5658 family protein [Steroidobacteraceae bacterium]|nr:DUF5658 family protein [Steroidobacteraceae bacterium]
MSATQFDRRSGLDRRSATLAAYWHGARYPRRRAGRRASDQQLAIVDWYSPRLLIPVMGTLALSVLDGLLTVMLMKHGAAELNPVMALFLPNDLVWFALLKMALTGGGLCVLVVFSRMRLFRRIPGEAIVYGVLGLYVWLIAYELRMLELVTLH